MGLPRGESRARLGTGRTGGRSLRVAYRGPGAGRRRRPRGGRVQETMRTKTRRRASRRCGARGRRAGGRPEGSLSYVNSMGQRPACGHGVAGPDRLQRRTGRHTQGGPTKSNVPGSSASASGHFPNHLLEDAPHPGSRQEGPGCPVLPPRARCCRPVPAAATCSPSGPAFVVK